jgi:hypothetical protein
MIVDKSPYHSSFAPAWAGIVKSAMACSRQSFASGTTPDDNNGCMLPAPENQMKRTHRYGLHRPAAVVMAILLLPNVVAGLQTESTSSLIEQFMSTNGFLRQFEVGKKIVALHDKTVLPRLEPLLKDDDRHIRGNAAFIFASLGDGRGFQVINDILMDDSSDRPPGQGIAVLECGIYRDALRNTKTPFCWTLQRQIDADRYYAAHLLGHLRDVRAVPILTSLLSDPDVEYTVPWALGEIGDKSAIPALIDTLRSTNPDMRVLAIYALQKLNAMVAVPQIRGLLHDEERIHFDGGGTVAEAARKALVELSAPQ